jgi:hypothetical protein
MLTARRSWTVVAFCLLLAACAGTGATPSAAPTGTSTPTGPTSSQIPVGQLPTGEPPPTDRAMSETDGPSALVIRVVSCNDVCGPNPGTTILSDGRVIWMSEGPAGGILVERTLSSSGLQRVRDAMDATGLLEVDGSYGPTLRPGADPPGHGAISHVFKVPRGDGFVRVRADDPGTFDGDNELLGAVWNIPQEARVLSALATNVGDMEAWLPADAWADTRRVHEASAYLLIVTSERPGDPPPFPDVDAVRWPFPGPIDAVGLPYTEQGVLVANSRCLPIDRAGAVALAAAERAVGHERAVTAPYNDLSYAWERGPGSVNVALRQLLPDQLVTCRDGGDW